MTGPHTVRVRLHLAYDGAPYHGFAANPGVPTIAGELTAALSQVLRADINLTGAGRTDRGVHAAGQVVSFDAPARGLDLHRLRRACNRLCGPAIVVRSAELAAPDFDARFSASARIYHYDVLNAAVPDPLRAARVWHVAEPLDVAAMNEAASHLVGEHDFSSFCRKRMVRDPESGEQVEATLVRNVVAAAWTALADDVLRLRIEANAFCHQMVRAITGTLVDVGRGRTTPDDLPAILAARDRSAAGTLAPPHGLTLAEVRY